MKTLRTTGVTLLLLLAGCAVPQAGVDQEQDGDFEPEAELQVDVESEPAPAV